MLKREGKVRPYTKTLDGGWGWMVVFHFFLVRIYFPLCYCLKEGSLRKAQSRLRSLMKSLTFEWKGG